MKEDIKIAKDISIKCRNFIYSDIYFETIKKDNENKTNPFNKFNFTFNNAVSSLEWCFKVFELLDENELHISGDAGMGKTHVSFNIYEDQIINQEEPAILFLLKK